MALLIPSIVGGVVAIGALSGIRIVRPTQRALIERMGRYKRFANPGFNWIIPIIDSMIKVDVTEQMVDAGGQEIITKDKLNATVDAQVYFKVKTDELSVKSSQYNVQNCKYQIVSLVRTTLRNIIGTMNLVEANSERGRINKALMETLQKETKNWGIEVVRAELKEITPPGDVQATMNQVVKAENTKTAAIDFATAAETQADGAKRASIKEAEGLRQAKILGAEAEKQSRILEAEGKKIASVSIAEGQAKAFELINTSFTGNAQKLKELEVAQTAIQNNSKILMGKDSKDILKLFSLNEK